VLWEHSLSRGDNPAVAGENEEDWIEAAAGLRSAVFLYPKQRPASAFLVCPPADLNGDGVPDAIWCVQLGYHPSARPRPAVTYFIALSGKDGSVLWATRRDSTYRAFSLNAFGVATEARPAETAAWICQGLVAPATGAPPALGFLAAASDHVMLVSPALGGAPL